MKFSTIATALVFVVISVFGAALPAHASPLTLDFSGSIDLTAFGGLASNTFSGSVTWDSAAVPFTTTPPTVDDYPVTGDSLTFNGVHLTPDPFSVPFIAVVNGGTFSDIAFDLFFDTALVSGSYRTNEFIGELIGPPALFASLALPGDFGFLPSLTSTQFILEGTSLERCCPQGPLLEVTAAPSVPEPATLTLTALGLVGVVGRYRRRSRFGS